MPPLPKAAHLRQRRNKVAGASTLPTSAEAKRNRVPALPKRAEGWHPMTLEWWDSVWRSPMASEYLDADMRGGLFQLAHLHQLFWEVTELGFAGVHKLPSLAAEIRLQEVRFGLSPIDRRRLQWEVEKGETAVERTQARRQTNKRAPKPTSDPRAAMKLVS